MQIRKAETHEYPAVLKFYYDLIDAMAFMLYSPRWTKGVYPDEAYLETAICQDTLWIAEDETGIAAAMIVNSTPNDGYDKAAWSFPAKNGEFLVIHTLGVAADRMHSGLGRAMVRKAIELAKETGKKAIRLDVVEDNLPAHKLYRSEGFRFAERALLYYEDTGWCNFDLYEYAVGD